MSYLLNTASQQRDMLATIGVAGIDELLHQIPDRLRLGRSLDLPPALTELELEQHVGSLLDRCNEPAVCFQGGGAYDHFIPAVVDEMTGRGEFYTAYTPYQAEASQGSLQAFFEYQSLVCQLTGMEAANASLYEGGSAVTEAAFMAMRVTGRERRVVAAGTLNPHFLQTLHTYFSPTGIELTVLPAVDGVVDPREWSRVVANDVACVIVQRPNALGIVEDVRPACTAARAQGALSVVVHDPVSLGLLKRPSELGADIVVAEGQSLGIPLQYGGPYLGMMACRKEFVRKMPGRIISVTTDRLGRHCFVLNLQGREQHIRREKATSNICTNQGLMALRAAVHLSLLGPQGLREAAALCLQKTAYAVEQLTAIPGVRRPFAGPVFKEFVVETPLDADALLASLRDQFGIAVGPSLATLGFDHAPSKRQFLVAVTEKRTRDEIDRLARAIAGCLNPNKNA